MPTYFRATKEYPYHLSIGAVVVNDEKKILCHHFKSLKLKGLEFKDLYILMRETIEPNETIEQCLSRGLREEFGVRAEIVHILGSLGSFIDDEISLIKQKTVVYFLCRFADFLPEGRLDGDPEGSSTLEWHEPEFLIARMKEQSKRLNRQDIDESEIVGRVL